MYVCDRALPYPLQADISLSKTSLTNARRAAFSCQRRPKLGQEVFGGHPFVCHGPPFPRREEGREPPEEPGPIMSPRMTSIRRRPKELFTSMSNKAIKLVHGRKKGAAGGGGDAEDDFGDGGVWQKTILMGDKCQPLDFSGVIYYDESGKKLNNLPVRSPRASPKRGNLS